jgi:4-amino-4-deoxy-L-arabinose transferase-like glycosyltransferase
MVYPGYRKRTIFLLILLLLVRFWFGQTFELSGQEAYLWLQGHGSNLSPSYWERGPLVPLLIRIGTTFFGDTELGVRWLAAVICCGAGFVLFYLARHWFNPRSAFWTVVLFIVIPMYAWKFSFMSEAAVSTGLMALTLFSFCLAVEEDKVWWWALGGLACGLGLLVALPNAWWLVGLGLYFASSPERRPRLREPLLWSAIIFAALFLLPLLWWWNGAQVADVRHSRFLGAWPLSHDLSFHQGFHFIWMEIFYLSPVFFVVLAAILWQLGRRVWDDPRYGMLVSLAVPGLLWQNFAAFFHEGRFELTCALFLPLVLLAGCYLSRLSNVDRISRLGFFAIYFLAALQALAGLNPFYFEAKLNGPGYELRRSESGENVTGFYVNKRRISWRNLADELQRLQQDQGANLIITDLPTPASALSFYLPHNPLVYVEGHPERITQFDFWVHYDEAATPNDSALYVTMSNDPPPAELVKNIAVTSELDEPPSSGFDKSWNIWSCQKFIGSPQGGAPGETPPMHESEPLPKK